MYEGQVVGEHGRDNDLAVNVTDPKKLTNMRASGSDKTAVLKPPLQFSLEMALEYIEDDELVEITPKSIRMRKTVSEGRRPQEGRAATGVIGYTCSTSSIRVNVASSNPVAASRRTPTSLLRRSAASAPSGAGVNANVISPAATRD